MNGYFGEWDESDYGESDYGESDYGESDYGESDYGEARRRPAPRRPPVRPSQARPAYRPPVSPGAVRSPVTQQQLKSALDNVARQIGINSNAIKTVDTRVRGFAAEQGRMGAALRKEIGERKKEVESVRGAIQETRTMAALLPLLMPQPTKVAVSGTENLLQDNSTGNFAMIAPLLLLGNDLFGGTSGTTGTAAGSSSGILGGGTTGLIALLALTGSLGK